jgi:predicted transcriptional regulator
MAARDPKQEESTGLKASTLRMPDSMSRQLGAIARADGHPVSEVLRVAIEEYIARRFSDEGLKERLRAVHEEDRDVLEDLGIEG